MISGLLGNRECYGVFCCTAYPSLITDDKQLHIGPCLIRHSMSEYWEGLGNTVAWLEEQIPQHTFTLVFGDWEEFENPYLWDGLRIRKRGGAIEKDNT